ncbi:MAG TPA: MG2 domain-containing protein, partial [Bacteroidia bacterium]|nr:MG2 domain-containing protein [Bacteroidia bacterium]
FGKAMAIDDKPITFHTPYLKLENVETFWTLKNGNTSAGVYVGMNLDFNYEVAPSAILQKLKLTQDKTLVQAELVSADDGKQVKLLFKPAEGETYPCPVTINIDKGVHCIGSNKETEQTIEYMAQIPPKDQFQVENALPVFENGQSYINVTTTQPVIAENIDQYVTIQPAVRLKITTTGNGFRVSGEFSNKQDYTFTISGKLRNIFGIELKDDYTTSIHFGTPPPYIAFSDKNSIYLSSAGNRNIAVQLISVPTVKMSVYKVYQNNILHYLRKGQQYLGGYYGGEGDGDDEGGSNYSYSYDYSADTTFGDVITRKELNTSSLPMTGMTSLLNITPADIQFDNSRKGIYLVQIQDKKKPWIQDSKLLVVSDIGMIVKKGQKNIYVFCHSLVNATKMQGIKITFVSDNNQEIYTAITDADGVATFEYDRSKYPGKDVVAIIAANGNDFSFMNLTDNTVNMSPFDIGGKTTNNVPYDAFMYSCRDLYRPGDTININSIVRTFDWHTLKDVPVKYKITMPNGKQLQEIKGKLDDEGSCAISFTTPTAAMTGAYSITMYSGNDVMLKSFQFMVEDFMPQRIKVNVQADAQEYEIGKPVKIYVQANELFGPPAANKNYQSTLDLDFTPFYSNHFSDYNFYITRPNNITFQQESSDGKTDDKGTATISYNLPDQANVGLLTGRSIVTVFDETGRPVNRDVQFKIYTQKVFYGIQSFDTWVGTNKPLSLNFAAADRNGNAYPSSTSAYVQIVKHSWETVLTNSSNTYRYVSQEVNHTVFYKDVNFSAGKASIDYTPTESGEYEVRILPYSGSNSYVTQYFYAYGAGSTQTNSFQVSKEGNIQIVAKQAVYIAGEDANLLFKCPFDGELVVTVEQNEMIEKFFVRTDNKAASIDIPIRKDYVPGVYVSAALIRPLSDNSLPLTIARGFIPLKVEDAANKMSVQITAVDNCHSKTTQTIKVKTQPYADVTIAAVDEGTLLITNFKTPDPYGYFYSKRALEVGTYDIYPRVLPELASSSMAGDEGLEGRLNPVGGKRVRILSYWSGIVKANGSGDC